MATRRPEPEEAPIEPDIEDIVVGDRGYEAFYAGKVIAEASNRSDEPMADLAVEIVDWMDRNKYWPAVWYADDHGGWHLWADVRKDAEERKAELDLAEEAEEAEYSRGNPSTEHTPGPWEYVNGTVWSPETEHKIAWMGHSKAQGTDVPYEEELGNANLVAAAPELLASVERMLPWIGKLIADGGHLRSVLPRDAEMAMRQASDVVAKAKGGGR